MQGFFCSAPISAGDDVMSRKRKITQKDVTDGLRRLAFGEIQDAVSLLFKTDEDITASLSSLDLFNVSEIKRVKGGGMEIKFFDRLKALEKLSNAVACDNGQNTVSFYTALEKSAAAFNHDREDDACD